MLFRSPVVCMNEEESEETVRWLEEQEREEGMSKREDEARLLATSLTVMSVKLDANHEKDGWKHISFFTLFARAQEEMEELKTELLRHGELEGKRDYRNGRRLESADNVINKVADVMNFCGMIIDNVAQDMSIEYPSTEQRWVKLIRKSEDRLARIRDIADGRDE